MSEQLQHGRMSRNLHPDNNPAIAPFRTGFRIRSLRRCPECHAELYTNGKGAFYCMTCEYEDVKDVSKLKALKYRGDSRQTWKRPGGEIYFKRSDGSVEYDAKGE